MQKKTNKRVDNTQPELKDIIDALNRYLAVNHGTAEVVFSCIAFDRDKMKRRADDIIKDGTDRLFICGNAKSLKHHLSAIRDCIRDDVDNNGNVST